MLNPVNTAISFVLLIAVVGASFVYVSGKPVEIVEPWLGITGSTITPEIVVELGLTHDQGFLIVCVEPSSPAANAGLKVDDIITEVDGNEVITRNDIAEVLQQKHIGESINFKIVRGTEQPRDVPLTLVDKPDRVSCTT